MPHDEEQAQKTLLQGDEALRQASDLSLPTEAVQHPEAPKLAGYLLVSRLGRGAYGEVWRAWQTRTRRWVAVKLFLDKRGLNWVLLQREVERLAQLDKHPYVVPLLDADMAGEVPFCALELESGGSLEDRCRPDSLADLDTVTGWLEKTAEGLLYVHARGIIHCDLKPANVLLDEEGRPRVADFGQARGVRLDSAALGTLYFMAPEQAAPAGERAKTAPDVRWDVYAFGATAYALLTGRLPHEHTLQKALAATAEGDLDARLAAYRKAVIADGVPAIGRPDVDRDLAAIVSKCLEPDPKRRYGGLGAVLADLRARRAGMPVGPLMHDRVYRARKFVRRNAVAVAVASIAACALAFAAARIVSERDQLRRQLAVSYLSQAHLQYELNDPVGAVSYAAEANRLAPSFVARATALAFLEELAAPRHVLSGLGAAVSADGKRLVAGWQKEAWVYDLATGKALTPPLLHEGAILATAFSADGKRVATGGQDNVARLWDPATGKQVEVLKHDAVVVVAKFSPDGSILATGSEDGAARLWDAATGKLLARLEMGDHVHDVQFYPDGRTLAATSEEGHTLGAWTVPAGKPVFPLQDLKEKVYTVDVSPDGRYIAVSQLAKRALLVDARTGKVLGEPLKHDNRVLQARFSPDGKLLATSSWDETVKLWKVPSGEPAGEPLKQEGTIRSIAWSRDGKRLLAGSTDGMARVWDLETRKTVGAKYDNASIVREVGFLPGDDDGFYSVSVDGLTRVWRHAAITPRGRILSHPNAVYDARYTADGKYLAVACKDGKARVYDRSDNVVMMVGTSTAALRVAELSRDDARLLTASLSGAHIWSFPDGKLLASLPIDRKPHKGAWSPDGSLAVVSARDGQTVVVDRDGRFVAKMRHPARTHDTKFSPDGKYVLTTGRDGSAVLWDARTGAQVGQKMQHGGEVETGAFFPDGSKVVTASEDHTAVVWEVPSGKRVKGMWLRHKEAVRTVAVSPDGSVIATGGDEPRVRLWNARTGEAFGRRIMHRAGMEALEFSPDGRVLLTLSSDRTAGLWDPTTGLPIGRPFEHDERVISGSFTPDGSAVATSSPDRTVRIWNLNWLNKELPPAEVVRRARVATAKRINADGDVQTFNLAEWRRLAAGGLPRD